jgi:hypothetical protein
MSLKSIVSAGAIAGALSFSAIGLATAASATPAPASTPGVVQHAQQAGWGGRGGWHGGGGGGWHGGPGWHGGGGWGRPGWGGPGPVGWGAPGLRPPCLLGICV